MDSKNKLWILFRSTFTLSAFTIGGGYVIVPLMRKRFVETYQWIDEQEMLDIIAIAQSAPGVIAVNTSILVGYKIAHVIGALVTLLGTILPPLIILSLFSLVYDMIQDNPIVRTLFYGMSIGVGAVIFDAVVSMARVIAKKREILSIVLMVGAFIAAYIYKVPIVLILVVCACVGLVTAYAARKKVQDGEQ